MRTEARAEARSAGLLLMGASALMLLLAVQNLPMRLLALSGEAGREKALAGASLEDPDVASFIRSRQNALMWRMDPEYADDLAAVYLAAATRPGIGVAEALPFLQQAEAYQIRALRAQAADTYGWSQLAFLNLQAGNDVAALADLRLSVDMAAYEPGLLTSRVDMMMALHDRLNAGELASIPFLIRHAWRWDARGLVVNAHDNNYMAQVESALSDEPAQMDRLQQIKKSLGF